MYGYDTFHDKIINTLIKSAREASCANAYLFEGEEGMYPLEAARLFANALVCEHPEAAPCGECRSCVEARANTNPDIIIAEHETGADGKPKKSFGADAARRLASDARIKPFNSPRKVYIIPDGENMTSEAQNTLLKTLEEPPDYAVFIIIAPSASAMLPTVVSRTVLIGFNPVGDDVILRRLKELCPGESPERLKFLVKYCGGVPGNADKIVADSDFEELREGSLGMMEALLSGDTARAFEVQDFARERRDRIETVIDIWISYMHDIALIGLDADKGIINSDKADALRRLSLRSDPRKSVHAAEELVNAKNMIKKSVKTEAVILKAALSV